jgi:hypothetical protein
MEAALKIVWEIAKGYAKVRQTQRPEKMVTATGTGQRASASGERDRAQRCRGTSQRRSALPARVNQTQDSAWR